MHFLMVGTARVYNYLLSLLIIIAQWSRTGTSNPEVYSGTEFKEDCRRQEKGQKKPSGFWNRKKGQRNRKKKAGTKRKKNGVSKKGKEKREGEKKKEREGGSESENESERERE